MKAILKKALIAFLIVDWLLINFLTGVVYYLYIKDAYFSEDRINVTEPFE